jgi:UDP-2,4-diacetamido-2,4,6-trideoxy-beta-L-altropyranose hydrolase
MHVAIRADGGPDIGFGHLVRTGALAATVLESGGDVTYLTRTPTSARRVCPEDIEAIELPDSEVGAVCRWVDETNPNIVFTDSYNANTDYQQTLRSIANASAVVLDDARYTVCADYLINGNIYAPDLTYEWTGPEPTWCLGTDYLLVRDPVCQQAEDPEPFRETPKRVVVTMGGSDIQGATPTAVRAFDGLGVAVDVVIGPGFDNHGRIHRAVGATEAQFALYEDPENFRELIARADVAVSAAGSTTYELLAVGTPTIAIPQADNQEPIANTLADRGAIERVDSAAMETLPERIESLLSDADRRRELRKRGRELVDCRGTERIYRSVCQAEA